MNRTLKESLISNIRQQFDAIKVKVFNLFKIWFKFLQIIIIIIKPKIKII
jgi:hypothetical protein